MTTTAPLSFLPNQGEMAKLIAAHDWSHSPLGRPETWSPTLKAAMAMILPADSQIVMFWGPEFAALYNDAYAPTIGDKHPHALGCPARQYWAELWDDLEPLLRSVRESGKTVSAKDRPFYIERHGFPETVYFDISYSAVRGEDGSVEGVLCLVNETTERVVAERTLRQSEERLRIATDAAAIGTWDYDLQTDVLSWDERCKQLFGLSPSAAVDYQTFLTGLHPDDRGPTDASVQAALEPGGAGRYDVEYRTISPDDGTERWIAATGKAYFEGDGASKRATRFTGTVIDITERKRADAVLRESEERFRNLADNSPMMVWVTDPDGQCVYLSRSWYEFTGQTEVEALGTGWLDAIHPEDKDRSARIFFAANERKEAFRLEYRIRRADGSYSWAIDAAGPRFDADGRYLGYVGSVVDIDDRIAAEEAQREQGRILETLNQTGAAVAAELDLQTVVQMVTDAGVELTGADFGAFFYNVINDSGEEYMLFTLSGAERSQFENFGMPRNTDVFAPTFNGEGVVRSDDITRDPRYGRNAPHKGMPKGHLPVCSYLAAPVASRAGEVIGGLFFGHKEAAQFNASHEHLIIGLAAQAATSIDNARLYQAVQRANETLEQRVHERTAELETANEALRQAQKMEAIGQLTGGIAHDFNNMLTVIRGSADVLQRGEIDEVKRQRYLQAIADTSDRAARLTSQLLAFARRQALKPEVFEVTERVTAIGDMLRTVLGSRITLHIDGDCHDCFVETDAAHFETALVNMAVNARDAMDGEGDVHIAIGAVPSLQSSGPQNEGGYATVSVTDSGHGIPAADLDRIFEPFFTTKETGKGTGLGLSQVYGFAKQSGGEVEVSSKLGSGTTFTMYLPRVSSSRRPTEARTSHVRQPQAEGCVLVVEDNPEVGAFAEQALADLGFKTRRATTAAEALGLLEDGNEFDVVFSDIVMPGQSGIDLARVVRQRWPELPVVLTTGYSDALAMQHEDSFPVLHKPYSLDALSTALGKAVKS